MTTAIMTRTWVDEAAAVLRDLPGISLQRDVPLAAHTYIGVGGPAPLFLAPTSVEALAAAIGRLSGAGVRFDLLGAGSNLLVADAGPSFVVIATEALAAEPRVEGATVTVDAGFSVPRLVQRLQRAGLAGLEFAEGIPGSVGGAVRMNAGWHEGEFGNAVGSLVLVRRDGTIESVAATPGTFAYRRSPGVGDRIVAGATLRLAPDDPARVAERMRGFRDHRVRTQPTGERNAGCMFKNPPGDHAGRLLDACGLKGTTVGGAQVSAVHANFFINLGGATFRDVATLMDQARDEVARRTGVTLEPEVILWR
ncbi:MAG TPA: UDP-N-acetylmuramate dehydrogenase [Candidatus Polarisedimenticolia bacterium]|nr:UDP-N-acetylmuramate dehydrogenase [Candidatus Polarisedimenticolia bacterium]